MTDLKTLMDSFLLNLVIEIGDEEMCAKTLLPGASINGEYVAECGALAWVRLMNASLSSVFPAPEQRPNFCATSLAVPVEMGIIRAAPQMTETARRIILPTTADNTNAAHRQYDDLEIMRRTLVRNQRIVDDFVAGVYTPVGPDNGVVGGSWPFTFGMD
jgi:hypothetical protein